ncbi:tartrate dehydrogenase [Reichenbachiella versicolor]|uniref:tartrate dehydrogenase n=1 Tax=Reichenbachiella versicolor TaxID=1821036 RepID=UPI000D6DCF50|nr:tartrate dehydrogenase [Reichenbachiella versicolor]
MKSYKIAAVNGDGIGNEIVPAGVEVLIEISKKHGFEMNFDTYHYGAQYYKDHGHFLPEDGLDTLKKYDAIYFGAVGLPEVDDTLPFKLYTNFMRTNFKQYVNLRPVHLWDGIASPLASKGKKDIDFVIIRENNEGEFVQNGRQMYPDSPEGFATETALFTRQGTTRVAHYAFRLAQKRRKKLTNVTKSNTLIHTLSYWDRVIEEVAQEYPDVEYQKMYVDNASASFVLHPEVFDVILTTNMIGDILSDLGGAIMGSLGLGGSGNINPENDFPSMFEPIHGSAPDIAGKNIANPIGQFWSGALMLEHLGENVAASDLMKAIHKMTSSGLKTKDLGGTATTDDITKATIAAVLESEVAV